MRKSCANIRIAGLGIWMVLGWGMAQADVVSFVINPATSFVQFDLDSEQATFVEQTPGSLQTTFSDTIDIDVDDPMNPGSIQVVGASAQADDNGSSEPGPAPANAAGEWATFYSTPRDVAFRNIVVDIQGPAQALNLKDNGFNVIIGQAKRFKKDWKPIGIMMGMNICVIGFVYRSW